MLIWEYKNEELNLIFRNDLESVENALNIHIFDKKNFI